MSWYMYWNMILLSIEISSMCDPLEKKCSAVEVFPSATPVLALDEDQHTSATTFAFSKFIFCSERSTWSKWISKDTSGDDHIIDKPTDMLSPGEDATNTSTPRNPETVILLPAELVREVIDWIKEILLKSMDTRACKKMLLTMCLVSQYWNSVFTPELYESIAAVDGHAVSLLRHTLWHVHPSRKHLIRRICVSGADSVWAVVSSNLPNLYFFKIYDLDFSRLHPRLVQYLRLLSNRCSIELCPGEVSSDVVPGWIEFLRRSRVLSCELMIKLDRSEIRKTQSEWLIPFFVWN